MTSTPPPTCPDCASPTLGTDLPGVRFCYRCQRQIIVQTDNDPLDLADRPQTGTGRGRGAGATVDGRAEYRTQAQTGGRVQTFEIPLPPTRCMPNQHCHWRSKGASIRQYRREAFDAICAADAMPFPGSVRLAVTFYCARRVHDGRYRPNDIANGIASLKAACDALVDARIISDDNYRVLSWGDVRIVKDKAEHGGRACVVLELRAEESG